MLFVGAPHTNGPTNTAGHASTSIDSDDGDLPRGNFPEPPLDSEVAIVSYIVDGDTLDVYLGDKEVRVRLLNVNAPEIGYDGESSECLAHEAASYLEGIVPPGTAITLGFDEVRVDPYERMLAAIWVTDGDTDLLVNAELARSGLVESAYYGDNERYLDPIQDAEAEARMAERGIHAAGAC